MKLTLRQEKFVEYFILCGNAAEAARLAGYSAKTARVIGPENLLKPAVLEAVRERKASLARELSLSRDDVIAGVLQAIKIAREERNSGAMISGWSQLAKMCGFFEQETRSSELSGDAKALQTRFAQMSESELLLLATR